jgi:PAS domain S-box-containing protein
MISEELSEINGQPFWFSTNLQPIRDGHGHVKAVQAVVRDISSLKQAEQALRKSEERLRQVVRVSHIGIFDHDHLTNTIYWSPQQRAIYGWGPDETVTLPAYLECVYPEDRERIAAAVRRAHNPAGDGLFDVEHRIVRRDGAIRRLTTRSQTFFDGEGGARHPARTVGAVRDITEHKQAEEMTTRLGRILDASLNEIYIFEANTFQFIQVNQGAQENLGYSMAELRHLTPLDLKPEFTPEAFAKLLEPLRTGEKEKIRFTTIHRRKDNSSYPVEVYLQLSTFESSPVFIAIILDITERKQAEAALERSEKHFRSLIENALDIITILNSDSSIRYESPSIERVLGYKPEELVGQNVFEFVHPGDLPHVIKTFTERSQIAGLAPPIEVRFRHKDGSWCILEVISSNLLDDPVMAGIVVNSRDITARRQLEEQFRQSHKMEAIGKLAGGVAHDFNNILTVITGYTELLLQLHPDEHDAERKDLEQIKRAGDRAASLTRQLLAFSRQQILQLRVLNLNDVVADMSKMLRRLIGEDIDLVILLDEELGHVKADPGQIEQVILNLAINARDAMPQGGKLTIETANVNLDEDYARRYVEVEPGPYVMLAVSDTGIGMDEEIQSHLFEPFFTTKEQGKGTGLGLATVHGIVNQSGGRIWVYSEPEQGTTFKIYLPRTDEAIESGDWDQAPAKLLWGSETILLVEDEDMVRELARHILTENGYAVVAARHGEEALQFCKRHGGPIHLLLTDVIMPHGMSGRQLAERLALLRPEMKILYMSGYTDNAIVHHGVLDSGINFLQKPFAMDVLVSKVRQALDTPQSKLVNGQIIED